jgi:hypothetical protein
LCQNRAKIGELAAKNVQRGTAKTVGEVYPLADLARPFSKVTLLHRK